MIDSLQFAQSMKSHRKAAEEKKQRAKAAKDWREKAAGRAKPHNIGKGYATVLCPSFRRQTSSPLEVILGSFVYRDCAYRDCPSVQAKLPVQDGGLALHRILHCMQGEEEGCSCCSRSAK